MRRVSAGALVAVLLLAACESASDTRADDGPTPASTEASATSAPTTPVEEPETAAQQADSPSATETRRRVLSARLIDAAWDNDLDRVKRLIGDGADVNAKDDREESAYLVATSEGHLRLLEITLDHGADAHALDSFRGTGLIRAAERGHADVVGRLLQTDIDVDHVNRLGWTALHEAIILGDGSRRYVDTVRLLVARGADVGLPSEEDGVLPLDHATAKGFDAIATTLRAAGRAERLDAGQTRALLLRGARDGDADRVAVALRAGAPLEARDGRGRTPLLLAVEARSPAAARLLALLGADPAAADSQGRTPLGLARSTDAAALARLLSRI